MKKCFIFFCLVFCLQTHLNAQTQLVKVGDTIRQFTIYVPPNVTNSLPVPLLLNFHGQGMTSGEQMLYSQTNALAKEKGFIAVYPQGINNDWNVGFDMDYDKGTEDVAFVKTLLEKLKKYYPIDTTKVFAIGISRGGFFIQRLVSELPHALQGIAVVGAPMPLEVYRRMPANASTKVMYVHGDKDEIVAIEGEKEYYLSLEETLRFWRVRNNSSKEAEAKVLNAAPNDGTKARFFRTEVHLKLVCY